MKNLLPILLAVVVCACSQDQPINTESETLNTMLTQAPLQTIDLDEHPADTVYVERFIHFRSLELEREGVFISNVVSLDHTENYFYIFTKKAPFIVQFDRAGNLIKKISRKGRGPNEYGYINRTAKNNDYIFIMDGGNARINMYDHKMIYDKSFSKKNVTYAHSISDMAVTQKKMLLKTPEGNQNLIRVENLEVTQLENLTFFPRLIPPGMQPKAVNNFFATTNDQGNLALSYLGLPFVFIYDSTFKLKLTLALYSSQIIENKASLELEPDIGIGKGIKQILSELRWIDSNNLFIVTPTNTVNVLSRNNEKFYVRGQYKLGYKNSEEAEKHDHGVNVRVVDIDENYVYMTSSFDNGIYRFPLSKIGL